MPPKKEQIGSGITKSIRTNYDDAPVTGILTTLSNIAHAFSGQMPWLDDIEADLREAAKIAGMGDDPTVGEFKERDELQWYISEAIRCVVYMRESADDEPHFAIYSALRLGQLLTEADIKFKWESFALAGFRRRSDLEAARDRHNRSRRKAYSAEADAWKQEAEKIWAANPRLSKNAVSEIVRIRLGTSKSADWISRAITKPRSAG